MDWCFEARASHSRTTKRHSLTRSINCNFPGCDPQTPGLTRHAPWLQSPFNGISVGGGSVAVKLILLSLGILAHAIRAADNYPASAAPASATTTRSSTASRESRVGPVRSRRCSPQLKQARALTRDVFQARALAKTRRDWLLTLEISSKWRCSQLVDGHTGHNRVVIFDTYSALIHTPADCRACFVDRLASLNPPSIQISLDCHRRHD